MFPRFWAALEAPAKEVERHDFALTKVDNDRHVMLAVTDIHLSNQNSDIEQFCTRFIPDVRAVAESFGDTPVYSLNMGDSAWDGYWYTNRYSLKDFRRTMNIVGYPAQMFCAMGNHDNDGATIHSDSVDWRLRALPPHHRAALLLVQHRQGTLRRTRQPDLCQLAQEEQQRRDRRQTRLRPPRGFPPTRLAAARSGDGRGQVGAVVVAMHAATYRYNKFNDKVTAGLSDPAYSAELKACFDGFEEVHYVSGHIHKNLLARVDDRLIEHNIGAVCGSWWRTGANHFQMLGPDAGPNGYAIFTIDGKRMQWTYRSIEDGDKQFRAYDMNEVARYYTASEDVAEFLAHYPERHDFREEAGGNRVFINVWCWEPAWKIRVTENGRELPVRREQTEDPLYVISYDIPQSVWKGKYPVDYGKRGKQHTLFTVDASGPATTLEIEVTDSFGKVYRETMVRPKAFGPQMK